MHTETGNIWTHFLAIPLFGVLFIYFNIFPTSPLLEDQLILAFYLLSGICCWETVKILTRKFKCYTIVIKFSSNI